MLLLKKYMADETVLYKCLNEVSEYCQNHGYGFKMIDTEENEKVFKIELSKGMYIGIRIGITSNEHVRPKPLIVVAIESSSAHTNTTKKITQAVKATGKVVGGGIGAVVSIATTGIGWILGSGITYTAAQIGEVPGIIVDKLDDFLTEAVLDKYSHDVRAVMAIFDERMASVPDIQADESALEYSNKYIKENGLFISQLQYDKKDISISYNKMVQEKRKTKFYSTVTAKEDELVAELSNKVVEKATITNNQDVETEITLETVSFVMEQLYEEVMEKKNNSDITMTKEELVLELRRKLIGER